MRESNTLDSNPPRSNRLQIEICVDPAVDSPVNNDDLKHAIERTAELRGFHRGEIGLRVTDDDSIHQINLLHLKHDYPTDVISYVYHAASPDIDGEIVVSVETARRIADQIGWSAENELTLYVVHGVLHLTGMNDQQADQRTEMRQMEIQVLSSLGIEMANRFGPDHDGVDPSHRDAERPDLDRSANAQRETQP